MNSDEECSRAAANTTLIIIQTSLLLRGQIRFFKDTCQLESELHLLPAHVPLLQFYAIGLGKNEADEAKCENANWGVSQSNALWEEVFVSHTHILLQRLRPAQLWGAQRPKITNEPPSCTLSLRGPTLGQQSSCGSAVTRNTRKANRFADGRESQQAIEGDTCNYT